MNYQTVDLNGHRYRLKKRKRRLSPVAIVSLIASVGVLGLAATTQINLTTQVSGVLPLANGGTNSSSTTVSGHQYFGNNTASSAAPGYVQPSCSDLSNAGGGCSMSTTAGGDLSGTLPSPTVAKIEGGSIPASASLIGTNSSSQPVSAAATNLEAVRIATTTGSSNAYVLTLSPAVTSYTNLCTEFISSFSNTGASTLNINSVGAKSIAKGGTNALALLSGDITSGQVVGVCYDGTQFEMMSSLGNSTLTNADFVDDETPSGSCNGSNQTFTLANTPNPSTSLLLRYNGQIVEPGGADYTLSSATITTVFTCKSGDILRAAYRR